MRCVAIRRKCNDTCRQSIGESIVIADFVMQVEGFTIILQRAHTSHIAILKVLGGPHIEWRVKLKLQVTNAPGVINAGLSNK